MNDSEKHKLLIDAGWKIYITPDEHLYISPADGEVYTLLLAYYIETMGANDAE